MRRTNFGFVGVDLFSSQMLIDGIIGADGDHDRLCFEKIRTQAAQQVSGYELQTAPTVDTAYQWTITVTIGRDKGSWLSALGDHFFEHALQFIELLSGNILRVNRDKLLAFAHLPHLGAQALQ